MVLVVILIDLFVVISSKSEKLPVLLWKFALRRAAPQLRSQHGQPDRGLAWG